MSSAILTGDINLMNVEDPEVPFRKILPTLQAADVRFSNLECSLHRPEHGHTLEHEGFFADPEVGAAALKIGGIDAVGIANNVNYGEANIVGSIATLNRHGIPFAGAGMNVQEARKPIVVERGGVRYGFLQRSSVYWSTNHEAGETGVGIAVIRGHTAYHVPVYRDGSKTPPFNRPGIAPLIITWADKAYLKAFAEDIRALASQVDVVIASCHWGLGDQVLTYMEEIAQTAIEAGAHIVMGHGPHQPLPVGSHLGRPIFYGLGSFSFHTGHLGIKHGDWIGLMVRLVDGGTPQQRTLFRCVRHNDDNETIPVAVADEQPFLERLTRRSRTYGAALVAQGDEIEVTPVQDA